VLTKQPDCVAPEKAELNKRIEALELEVKKLRRAQNKKQKKSPIK
jgi:chaperonin cofactor prefoldin